MRGAHAAIAALGVSVIAVGTGSPAQAQRLMEAGSPFPCLVDPQRRLYRVLGLGRVGFRTLLALSTYTNYWRAWRRGARQGRVTGDPGQLSGVAIVDADGRLRGLHVSRTIGDYPPMADLLAMLSHW